VPFPQKFDAHRSLFKAGYWYSTVACEPVRILTGPSAKHGDHSLPNTRPVTSTFDDQRSRGGWDAHPTVRYSMPSPFQGLARRARSLLANPLTRRVMLLHWKCSLTLENRSHHSKPPRLAKRNDRNRALCPGREIHSNTGSLARNRPWLSATAASCSLPAFQSSHLQRGINEAISAMISERMPIVPTRTIRWQAPS